MADMFKRTITAHDCTNLVGVMPGRPIFQLDYPDGSVVVKPESGGTPIDFRHVSRVMRIADPESAAVALTNRERASLALLAVRPLEPRLERPYSFVRQRQKFRSQVMDELYQFARGYVRAGDA